MRVQVRGHFPGTTALPGLGFDVVHRGEADLALFAHPTAALPALASGRGAPAVVRVPASAPVLDRTARRLLGRAASIVVPTWARIGEVREAYGVLRRKVDVVPLAVDPAFWTPSAGTPEQPLAVLLLDLPRPERVATVGAVRESGVPTRVFTPALLRGHDDALRTLLHQATVVLVAARGDAHLLTALEVAAAGTPLVVADRPGTTEYFRPGETAAVVPGGRPAEAAAAVRALLTDPARAQAQSKAAIDDVATRFSLGVAGASLAQVLRRVGP